MDSEKYNRSIILHCPTCGGDEFKYDDETEDSPRTCTVCEREFSQEELLEANAESIEQHKREIVDDIKKDYRRQLKNAFKGNKWITIK